MKTSSFSQAMCWSCRRPRARPWSGTSPRCSTSPLSGRPFERIELMEPSMSLFLSCNSLTKDIPQNVANIFQLVSRQSGIDRQRNTALPNTLGLAEGRRIKTVMLSIISHAMKRLIMDRCPNASFAEKLDQAVPADLGLRCQDD